MLRNKFPAPLYLFLALFVLAGCLPVGAASTPTASPTTPAPATATQTATPSPTLTPTPIPYTPTATRTATHTPTPTLNPSGSQIGPDLELPLVEIEILSPADGARLVSPVQLRVNMFPGPQGRLRIELLGEDGRLLTRKLLVWTLIDNVKQLIRAELDFEIAGVAEAGRLIVSVDDEYGRLKALSSVDVLLLAEGLREASFSQDLQEKILILSPQANRALDSGEIEISGIARPQSERPLLVQVIARDGRVLATGDAYVAHPEGYPYGVFSITLQAEVTVRQWVQITVREIGDRVPGEVHLSSIEVVLAP